MEKSKSLVSVFELKRLLISLKEARPDICVRYRLMGEMWVTGFRRVVRVGEKGALFNDEASNRIFTVFDLAFIMQFEIDRRFQNYQPFFHYDVRPLPEI